MGERLQACQPQSAGGEQRHQPIRTSGVSCANEDESSLARGLHEFEHGWQPISMDASVVRLPGRSCGIVVRVLSSRSVSIAKPQSLRCELGPCPHEALVIHVYRFLAPQCGKHAKHGKAALSALDSSALVIER